MKSFFLPGLQSVGLFCSVVSLFFHSRLVSVGLNAKGLLGRTGDAMYQRFLSEAIEDVQCVCLGYCDGVPDVC
jgi:hypothetical protein